jgi:hypothetical protein
MKTRITRKITIMAIISMIKTVIVITGTAGTKPIRKILVIGRHNVT